MAFPQVNGVTGTSNATDTTSHDVDLPATVVDDELLVMFLTVDDGATITTPSGWTELVKTEGSLISAAVYLKKGVSADGGTTVSVTTGSSVTSTAQVYRISAWGGTIASDVDGNIRSAESSSSSVFHDSFTPSAGGSTDRLWFIGLHFVDDDATVSSYATGYGNGQYQPCGSTNNNNATTASARRELNDTDEAFDSSTLSESESTIGSRVAIEPGSAGTGGGGGTIPVAMHHYRQLRTRG